MTAAQAVRARAIKFEKEKVLAGIAVNEDIARGMALLDKAHPGWDERINLARLELADGDRCVLGQLYGDYEVGLHAFGHGNWDDADDAWATEHGFSIPMIDDDEWDEETSKLNNNRWEKLTEGWRDAITARR